MDIANFLKFITSPKVYINQLVSLNTDKEIEKLTQSDFLIPIDETKPEDVFIVGFPKSGNTWMQSLTAGLLYGIDTEFMPDKLAQEIVPDVHVRKYYKRFGNVNFFKSHHLPQKHYKKVIYLVRDGRDSMVSYYHFNRKKNIDVSLEEMIKNGQHVFPSKWHVHVRKWQDNPFNSEIMTIRYEDLLEQPLVELRKICAFANLMRPDELIKKVIEGNHIDKMRKRVEEGGGMGHKDWTGKKGSQFFRKGITGSHLIEMESSLQEHFNEESSKELKLFGYLI